MHVCVCVCVCMWACMCLCVCVDMCVCVCVCVCVVSTQRQNVTTRISSHEPIKSLVAFLVSRRDTDAHYVSGYNVTLVNKMMANYTWASRDTTIYWTSEIGTVNETTVWATYQLRGDNYNNSNAQGMLVGTCHKWMLYSLIFKCPRCILP